MNNFSNTKSSSDLYLWQSILSIAVSTCDCKEIKPVNPKALQPWILTGRTDTEAPILWPPVAKDWLFGKDPDAGKDWRQKEKGVVEDEKFRCLQRLNGHEFEQTLKDSGGRGTWHAAVHDVTKNWTRLINWKMMTTSIYHLSPTPPTINCMFVITTLKWEKKYLLPGQAGAHWLFPPLASGSRSICSEMN